MKEKKPYCRIEFKNCGTPYDYTVCEWSDIKHQMEIAESSFIDTEESEFPQIIITTVFITEEEYNEQLKSWDV